ncbi:MAG: hypothetical protein Q9N34_02025 [Aquificota bacterium]|nr:hypothetical protein [Aquificota bacterium]
MHIIQILRELSTNEGKTVLMISHDIGPVLRNVDKVLCLNRKVYYYGESKGPLETIEAVWYKGEHQRWSCLATTSFSEGYSQA